MAAADAAAPATLCLGRRLELGQALGPGAGLARLSTQRCACDTGAGKKCAARAVKHTAASRTKAHVRHLAAARARAAVRLLWVDL
mmetsp:Transcript_34080/g.86261  ORF Transcript_34080/g.86261 Transcript_34080/m.86261 type:complete len:85 (+) Transcript_34080:986-1240(+)